MTYSGQGEANMELNTGVKMPTLAFGTLMNNLEPDHDTTVNVIRSALDAGYRHLDTASIYGTEKMIGQVVNERIQNGCLKREHVFITTKLWRNSFRRDDVVPALKQSLKQLNLDYVDLYLIHWPTAFKPGETFWPKDDDGNFITSEVDYLETWKGMEECYSLGLAKAIGISNFNSKQIQRILDNCLVKPVNLQIECHPHLTNSKLIEYCKSKGITVMAYSPLGGSSSHRKDCPTIYTDPVIQGIAKAHEKTPAQIALRFQVQRGVGVAPKSSNPDRMKQNLQLFDFTLSVEEMKLMESCNRNYRLNDELPKHPYYPFNEEF